VSNVVDLAERRGTRRNKTEGVNRTTKSQRRLRVLDAAELADYDRPKARGDCMRTSGTEHAERPCPWVGCQHNLYLDVNKSTGSVTLNHPELAGPEEMKHSCVLDLTDEGSYSLDDTGRLLNVTRERIRQIENRALMLVKRKIVDAKHALGDFVEGVDKLDRIGPLSMTTAYGVSWRKAVHMARWSRERVHLDEVSDVAEPTEDASEPEDDENASLGARGIWDLAREETNARHRAAVDGAWRAYINESIARGLAPASKDPKCAAELARVEEHLARTKTGSTEDTMTTKEEIAERKMKIVQALQAGPLGPVEIAKRIGVARGATSRTLHAMRDDKDVVTNGETQAKLLYGVPGTKFDGATASPERAERPRATRPRKERKLAPPKVSDLSAGKGPARFTVRIGALAVECATADEVLELARAAG
jgi:hypothetical protein